MIYWEPTTRRIGLEVSQTNSWAIFDSVHCSSISRTHELMSQVWARDLIWFIKWVKLELYYARLISLWADSICIYVYIFIYIYIIIFCYYFLVHLLFYIELARYVYMCSSFFSYWDYVIMTKYASLLSQKNLIYI